MKCSDRCGSPELLRELLDFLQGWHLSPVVERGPDESLTREEMHAAMARRAWTDPEFREALHANPRMVYMVALEEALGISKPDFLCQIDEVRLVEESAETLYLVLPTCHYGCQADGVTEAPAMETGTCHVCGMTLGSGRTGCSEAVTSPPVFDAGADRESIEARLLERAAREPAFYDGLRFRPQETYCEAVRALSGGELPDYLDGVREIRVMPETDRSIVFVMPWSAEAMENAEATQDRAVAG